MSAVTQDMSLPVGDVRTADLETRLNALKAGTNIVDADQLDTNLGEFSLNNTVKMADAVPPGVNYRTVGSEDNTLITKKYLRDSVAGEIDAKLDSGSLVTDLADVAEAAYTDPDAGSQLAEQYTATDAGISYTIKQADISKIPTTNEKAALTNANAPTGANPVATMADLSSSGNLCAIGGFPDGAFGTNSVNPGDTAYTPQFDLLFTTEPKFIQILDNGNIFPDLATGAYKPSDGSYIQDQCAALGVGQPTQYAAFLLKNVYIDMQNNKFYGGITTLATSASPDIVQTKVNPFSTPVTIVPGTWTTITTVQIMGGIVPAVISTMEIQCYKYNAGQHGVGFRGKITASATLISYISQRVLNLGGLGL